MTRTDPLIRLAAVLAAMAATVIIATAAPPASDADAMLAAAITRSICGDSK